MDKYDLQAIGIPQEQAKQLLQSINDLLFYRLEAFKVLHNNFTTVQRSWHRSLLAMQPNLVELVG